jgi:hypothetical protein
MAGHIFTLSITAAFLVPECYQSTISNPSTQILVDACTAWSMLNTTRTHRQRYGGVDADEAKAKASCSNPSSSALAGHHRHLQHPPRAARLGVQRRLRCPCHGHVIWCPRHSSPIVSYRELCSACRPAFLCLCRRWFPFSSFFVATCCLDGSKHHRLPVRYERMTETCFFVS